MSTKELNRIHMYAALWNVVNNETNTEAEELEKSNCFSDLWDDLQTFLSDVSEGKCSIENIPKKCNSLLARMDDWQLKEESYVPEYIDVEIERDEDDFMEDLNYD